MTRSTKVGIGILIFIITVGTAVSLLGYWVVMKSIPDYGDEIALSILEDKVQVNWDPYRIPHIYAKNNNDMFRVAGYVTAQERLWQMDIARRAAKGELSEIFGSRTAEQDKFARTMGFHRVAQHIAENLSEEANLALSMYAQGVNAFMEKNYNSLPLEFSILGYKPTPWEITDSIAFLRFVAFQLSFTWHSELALHRIVQKVGTEEAMILFPEFPADAPSIAMLEGLNGKAVEGTLRMLEQFRSGLANSRTVAASNSWVVAGNKSMSGKPILANDPHLDLRLPAVWFEMHLVSDQYNVAGVTFPGLPGIIIGHNESIAWGLTNGMIDDADFYFHKIEKKRPDAYWDGKEWRTFSVIREKIKVKNQNNPIIIDIKTSPNGPVVSDVHNLGPGADDTLALSIRWTGHSISDEMTAILKMNRAHSWKTFKEAVSHHKAPAQNFIYADTAGTIGYLLGGSIPIRRDRKGFLPYKGWERKGDWIGEVPRKNMPELVNPEKGFIATANNKITSAETGYYFGNSWEPDSRIIRIENLLNSKEKFSSADFSKMQVDVFSEHARKVIGRLEKLVPVEKLANADERIWKLLTTWNYNTDPESEPAAVFNVFAVHILRNCLLDEMGDDIFESFLFWTNYPVRALESLLENPNASWWDDKNTERIETFQFILLKSFRESIFYLNDNMGDGPGFWDWGRLHKMTFRHILGQDATLAKFFNVGPLYIGGSPSTIAKSEYHFANPFDASAGASMRYIIDLAEPLKAQSVIAGGQSGQPHSGHYADQLDLWLNGKLKTVVIDKKQIEAGTDKMQIFNRPDTAN